MARFVPYTAGFRQLRTGKEVHDMVKQESAKRAQMAGKHYESDTQIGANRAHGIVYTNDHRTARSNAKNNTLVKVLGQ